MSSLLESGRVRRPRRRITASVVLTVLIGTGLTLPPTAVAVEASPSRAVTISQIQGAGHRSPLTGQRVSGVEGVVIATSTRLHQFWMQSTTPDTNPATSDGLRVALADVSGLRAGDLVQVTGSVVEERPGGDQPANASLSITQLNAEPGAVTVLAHKRPLPEATVLGNGGRTPPTTVIKNNNAAPDAEHGAFDPTTQGLDFYESLEGMRVQINNPVAVAPVRSGSVTVVADRGRDATIPSSRGALPARASDPNPERLILANTLLRDALPDTSDVGDRFTTACGVLDYQYSTYRVLLTCPLTRTPGGLTKEHTTPPKPGELTVATFNVENLAATSNPEKFKRLAETIHTNLADPDVVILEEVQDNDGTTQATPPITAADKTWTTFITAAGGPHYHYRQIDPINNADGGIPGGNIRVGFLFRTDTGLQFVDRPGGTATTPTTIRPDGTLSISPGRIEPTNPAFRNTRKSLAGEFLYHGKRLIIIANHLTAQRGDGPQFGRFQPPATPSRRQRGEQTAILVTFTQQLLARDPAARIVLAGDFNDTEFSPPVQTLRKLGLTNLPATLPENERYTYIYQGNAQAIDHILLSPQPHQTGYRYDIVHVNTEFADQVSDHDPQIAQLHIS